jgi:hypothetical protein
VTERLHGGGSFTQLRKFVLPIFCPRLPRREVENKKTSGKYYYSFLLHLSPFLSYPAKILNYSFKPFSPTLNLNITSTGIIFKTSNMGSVEAPSMSTLPQPGHNWQISVKDKVIASKILFN